MTARIPADVEAPDKVIYGLTARQLAVLGLTGLVAGWVYLVSAPWLPLPVIAAAVLPVVAAGVVAAVARRDGIGLDRYALAAVRHLSAPKALIAAEAYGEGVAPPPAWCRLKGELPAPLRLPVRAVRTDGVMDLASGGVAVIVEAGTVPFGLRTAAEQAALVGAFGRWLNSLDAPAQIVVQARPVDLTGLADHLEEAADQLPHPALREAARDHADFLAELNSERELLTRRVLIILRDDTPHAGGGGLLGRRPGGRRRRDAGAAVVLRRAAEAVRGLAGAGVSVRLLDAQECGTVLAESLSPAETHLLSVNPEMAEPEQIITADHALTADAADATRTEAGS